MSLENSNALMVPACMELVGQPRKQKYTQNLEGTRVALLPETVKDTFQKMVFRDWTAKSRACDSGEEKQKKEPDDCPDFLPRGALQTGMQGTETQAGESGHPELRRQRSEFRARK